MIGYISLLISCIILLCLQIPLHSYNLSEYDKNNDNNAYLYTSWSIGILVVVTLCTAFILFRQYLNNRDLNNRQLNNRD